MIVAADSSVLIASLVGKDPHHEASVAVLEKYRPFVHRHALVETFSTPTSTTSNRSSGPAIPGFFTHDPGKEDD